MLNTKFTFPIILKQILHFFKLFYRTHPVVVEFPNYSLSNVKVIHLEVNYSTLLPTVCLFNDSEQGLLNW